MNKLDLKKISDEELLAEFQKRVSVMDRVIFKAKLLEKEIRTSDKKQREYAKLKIQGVKEFLWIWNKTLIEKLVGVKTDKFYNWIISDGEFIHVKGWEEWSCSSCSRVKLTELVVADNNRLEMIKLLFDTRIKNLKSGAEKDLLVKSKLIKDYEEIIEQLDKDIEENKKTLAEEGIMLEENIKK